MTLRVISQSNGALETVNIKLKSKQNDITHEIKTANKSAKFRVY